MHNLPPPFLIQPQPPNTPTSQTKNKQRQPVLPEALSPRTCSCIRRSGPDHGDGPAYRYNPAGTAVRIPDIWYGESNPGNRNGDRWTGKTLNRMSFSIQNIISKILKIFQPKFASLIHNLQKVSPIAINFLSGKPIWQFTNSVWMPGWNTPIWP